MTRCDWLGYA